MNVNARLPDAAEGPEKATGAPALEKGLDVIEALAEAPQGLNQKTVAERVGRSVGEIFRMLGVLERRGYVARDDKGHYALTLRLFELSNRHPPQRRLLEAAMQAMERLASDIGHANHLVVAHGDRLMVLAQVQPDSVLMGWSVRLGAVFPFSERFVSARIIAAFQRPERQAELVERMASQPDARSKAAIRKSIEKIARAGYDRAPSQVAVGVVDVSAPVLNHFGQAIAALTVPYVTPPGVVMADEAIIRSVREAADRISVAIGGSVVPTAPGASASLREP